MINSVFVKFYFFVAWLSSIKNCVMGKRKDKDKDKDLGNMVALIWFGKHIVEK